MVRHVFPTIEIVYFWHFQRFCECIIVRSFSVNYYLRNYFCFFFIDVTICNNFSQLSIAMIFVFINYFVVDHLYTQKTSHSSGRKGSELKLL